MASPIKICREPWSKCIQHVPAVKALTRAAWRKFRAETKQALRNGTEPPVNGSGGARY